MIKELTEGMIKVMHTEKEVNSQVTSTKAQPVPMLPHPQQPQDCGFPSLEDDTEAQGTAATLPSQSGGIAVAKVTSAW